MQGWQPAPRSGAGAVHLWLLLRGARAESLDLPGVAINAPSHSLLSLPAAAGPAAACPLLLLQGLATCPVVFWLLLLLYVCKRYTFF